MSSGSSPPDRNGRFRSTPISTRPIPTRNTMRPLNFSAERDEEEDFELNIRAVSGGLGMIVLADGVTQDPNVNNLVASRQRRPESVEGARRERLGCHQGVRPVWDPRADFARVQDRAGCDCRQGAVHRGKLPAMPRQRAVDHRQDPVYAAARRRRLQRRDRRDHRRIEDASAPSTRRRSTKFARTPRRRWERTATFLLRCSRSSRFRRPSSTTDRRSRWMKC